MKARLLLVLMLMPLAVAAQQRDATPAAIPTGTGVIAGVVVSADTNPQPVRRAVVTLTGDVPMARSVVTDDSGAFAFRSLPAGSFLVTARKAAYLAGRYGARRPGRAGTPIALAAGQQADISVTIFKGASIAGVLHDSAGLPVAGVDVRAVDVRVLNAAPDGSAPDLATTDDRGVFRIYGLMPGDYVIAALASVFGPEIGAPSAADIDRTLASLESRNRAVGVAPPPVPPEPNRHATGYAPVFFPGTPNAQEAAHVTVAAGEERGGVDFEVRPLPYAAIEATVSGDVPDLTAVQITIIPSGPRVVTTYSSSSLVGTPIDAQGRFQYGNLAPGRYRVAARARRTGDVPSAPAPVNGARIGGGGGAPSFGVNVPMAGGDALFAVADVDLRGEDVTGVGLVLQPGGTISGRLVFNGTTAKPADLTKVRIGLSLEGGSWSVSSGSLTMGPSFVGQTAASVKADGSFEIRGIAPGRFAFTCTLPPDVKGWSLRSAITGDRDLLDETVETAPGMDMRDVTITFSDTPSELSGMLQSASGQPGAAYDIVALPADRTLWRPKARRIVTTHPSTTGRFVFANLAAGTYLIAALNDLDPLDLMDPAFLEQIAASGLVVTISEGEKKSQDLRIK